LIAAVCITRNAEETLPRALDSVAPYVDLIVALMAGESTDRTEDILVDYGTCYEKAEWQDDFALARNQAFDVARRAGATWAILFDSDDIVCSGDNLRGLVAKLETAGASGAYLRIVFGNLRYYQKRVFNLTRPGKWICRVHEVYTSDAGDMWPQSPECEILHIRGLERQTPNRNMQIFEKWMAEAPQEWDARTYYNYGNELYWHGKWMDAARIYGISVALPQWKDERYFAHIRRGECYMEIQAWQAAWKELMDAAQIKPTWKDAYLRLSRLYFKMGLYALALGTSEFAEKQAIPDTIHPINHAVYKEQKIWDDKARKLLAQRSG